MHAVAFGLSAAVVTLIACAVAALYCVLGIAFARCGRAIGHSSQLTETCSQIAHAWSFAAAVAAGYMLAALWWLGWP